MKRQRGYGEWPFILVIVAIVCVVGLAWAQNAESDRLEALCKSKNGVWYQPSESDGICVKTEQVIKVE